VPARVDAGGAEGARRPAHQAPVRFVINQPASELTGFRKNERRRARSSPSLYLSLLVPRCSGRPAGVSGRVERRDRSVYWPPSPGSKIDDDDARARADAGDSFFDAWSRRGGRRRCK
jgi:hypothetical protein